MLSLHLRKISTYFVSRFITGLEKHLFEQVTYLLGQ